MRALSREMALASRYTGGPKELPSSVEWTWIRRCCNSSPGTLGDGWHDVDTNDPDTLAALASFRGQVVLAKESLSDDVDTSIPVVLPGLVRHVRLTRSEFEDLARPTIDLTVDTFASMLAHNRLTADQLQAVLLVGGTSRMPLIAQRLTSVLHLPVTVDEHPKYVVCLGAATLAAARLEPHSAAPAGSPPHDGERQEPADEPPVRRADGAGKLLAQPPITPMSAAGRPSVSMIADMLQAGGGRPCDRSPSATAARATTGRESAGRTVDHSRQRSITHQNHRRCLRPGADRRRSGGPADFPSIVR